jgi:pyridoxal 5'-phosphate synthase pdxT subunit
MSPSREITESEQITVGVLALQGAFFEHCLLLTQASKIVDPLQHGIWSFIEVRNPEELARCDALIIPGGESTTMALVAASSGLLEPLREFTKLVFPVSKFIF